MGRSYFNESDRHFRSKDLHSLLELDCLDRLLFLMSIVTVLDYPKLPPEHSSTV